MWGNEEVWQLIISVGVAASLLVVVVVVVRRGGGCRGFPPGPLGWPIIGNLGVFKEFPHQKLRKGAGVYGGGGGDMVGLRLGRQPAVVVSSPALAKQVLLAHDRVFANRPPHAFTSNLFFLNDIIFSSSGPSWRKQRKICMVELFTSKRLQTLEYVRQQELASLLLRLHHDSASATRPVDIGRCIGFMSSSIVSRLLYSRADTHVAGEDLQELIRQTEQESVPTVGDLIPWLFLLDFPRKRRMRSLRARLDKVLTTILAERKERNESEQYDDLLQALLSKLESVPAADVASPPSTQETLTVHEIKGIMMDMLAAGIHTTSLTLEWAMAELLRNPQCFRRLQEDIDAVLQGEKRQVTDADIPKLPYLKWVVKEVFRLHPVVPLLLPRISTEECKLNGYILPAKTLVFVNVWAIGRDERVWPNAHQFLPDRFEGNDTDLKGQHFELLPFGSGRRICLGLPLGLSIVEVTLANLVSSFDWQLPPGQTHTSIDMAEKKGLTVNRASPVLAIPKPRLSRSS